MKKAAYVSLVMVCFTLSSFAGCEHPVANFSQLWSKALGRAPSAVLTVGRFLIPRFLTDKLSLDLLQTHARELPANALEIMATGKKMAGSQDFVIMIRGNAYWLKLAQGGESPRFRVIPIEEAHPENASCDITATETLSSSGWRNVFLVPGSTTLFCLRRPSAQAVGVELSEQHAGEISSLLIKLGRESDGDKISLFRPSDLQMPPEAQFYRRSMLGNSSRIQSMGADLAISASWLTLIYLLIS